MADEPKVETPEVEVPVVVEPEVPVVVEPPVPPVVENVEMAALRERLARYEQLVVSPDYADFLAQKSRAAKPTPEAPKQYSAEERQAFQDKLNGMTRAELVSFTRDLVVDTVREQLFNPIVQNIVSEKVQNQIAEASAKHTDFWDYKQDMVALSNANPALTAEQVYHLAKASRAPKPAPAGKPPVRKPSGEAPSTTPSTPKDQPATNFDQAFNKAFEKSGL